MNTEKHIAFACFIGATIGALLALQFNHYFWWAGILLGGGVGYISYEFDHIISAMKKSWLMAKSEQQDFSHLKDIIMEKLGIIREILRVIALVIAFVLALMVSGALWFVLFYYLGVRAPDASFHFADFAFLFALIGIPGMFIGLVNLEVSGYDFEVSGFKCLYHLCIACSPLAFIFWWLPRYAIWTIRVTPKVVSFCLSFARMVIWETFKLVHSDLRLLCMTDAMFGALVGYFCGNALVGGITGALLGVLNYRFISVKWLKLVKV